MAELAREHRDLDHDDLVDLAEALWKPPVHELRAAAAELLTTYERLLTVADAPLLERLLRQSRTWALVDGLAASVVGAVVAREPEAWAPVLDRWSTDDDFWLRRSSMLALLGPIRHGGGDVDRFLRYADAMLDEREFFIRKAIGWVLRDLGRTRPDVVRRWLEPRAARASGVTFREAVKHLPEADRVALEQARGKER